MSEDETKETGIKRPKVSVFFTKPFGQAEVMMRAVFDDGTRLGNDATGRDDIVTAVASYIALQFTRHDKIGVVVRTEKPVDFWLDFYKRQHDSGHSTSAYISSCINPALKYGVEIAADALTHCFPGMSAVRCLDYETAITGGDGVFFGAERTKGAKESIATAAEIDRLRVRIRFLEQDVERAFSTIAELSTRGKGF
jgi:hypothetical protein